MKAKTIKEEFGYTGFAAITLELGRKDKPVLAYLQGDKVNWRTGGFCYLDEGKVNKRYPRIANWNDALRAYLRDYPVKPVPIGRNGWLSPNGKFFVCRYAEHESLADLLSVQFYKNDSGSKTLEDKGWLKLVHNGNSMYYIHADSFIPTQRQIDAVGELFRTETGKLKDSLREGFEGILALRQV